MRACRSIFPLIFVAALAPLTATSADKQPLNCDIGPINKIYGKTNWLVYSCGDGKTIVVVSDTGNPAMPFYFIFHPKAGGYQLYGEGTGKKEATAAAYDDLKVLAEPDIKALIAETVKVKEQKKSDRGKSP